jgi:acid phosphatase type 7
MSRMGGYGNLRCLVWLPGFCLLFALVGSTLLAAFLPQSAAAESNVTLIPASGPTGTRASLLGRDFGKRDRVSVRLGGAIVAKARTGRHGSFRASFIVPQGRASRPKVVTRSGHRRIVNVFRVAGPSDPAVGEVASRRGRRMQWTPINAPAGSAIRLSGSQFPPRRRLRIRFGGRDAGRARTNRNGRFSTMVTAPAISAERHLVRVKLRTRALGFFFEITLDPGPAPGAGPGAGAGALGVAPGAAPEDGTAGLQGAGSQPVIAAAGDIACAPGDSSSATQCREMKTSDIIAGGGISSVLALGDLQYNSASLSNLVGSYDRSWGRFKSITRPVLGNHESSGSGYFDYFNGSGVTNGPAGERGSGYYSYEVGSWHLIALNSNCSRVPCDAGSAQLRWLATDLAANRRTCTLAYWHHPRFSSGHDGDGTFMQSIWKMLYDANADVVLVGHSHDYERFAPMNADGVLDRTRGMREFVVGTGGAFFTGIGSGKPNSEVRQNSAFGVLKLTLRPTSYDWRFVPEAGETFTDTGSQACH